MEPPLIDHSPPVGAPVGVALPSLCHVSVKHSVGETRLKYLLHNKIVLLYVFYTFRVL